MSNPDRSATDCPRPHHLLLAGERCPTCRATPASAPPEPRRTTLTPEELERLAARVKELAAGLAEARAQYEAAARVSKATLDWEATI